MSTRRDRLYRVLFVAGLAILLAGMGLGLWEVLVEHETVPSLVFQNIAEIEQLMDSGRYDDAISRLNMTLVLFPSDQHLVHNLLGNAYNAKGDAEEAIEQYRRALRYDPDFAEARNNLGVALARAGRRLDAMEELGRAIDLRPDYREARDNLARVVRTWERQAPGGAPTPEVVETARRRLGGSGPSTSTASTAVDAPALARGRESLQLLLDGDLMRFRGRFTEEFASRTSIDDLGKLRERLQDQIGEEVERLGERVVSEGRYELYVRVSRFSAADDLVEWSLLLDASGSIEDMRIRLGQER